MSDTKILENPYSGLEIVDGHAVKAPEDYQDPKKHREKWVFP